MVGRRASRSSKRPPSACEESSWDRLQPVIPRLVILERSPRSEGPHAHSYARRLVAQFRSSPLPLGCGRGPSGAICVFLFCANRATRVRAGGAAPPVIRCHLLFRWPLTDDDGRRFSKRAIGNAGGVPAPASAADASPHRRVTMLARRIASTAPRQP